MLSPRRLARWSTVGRWRRPCATAPLADNSAIPESPLTQVSLHSKFSVAAIAMRKPQVTILQEHSAREAWGMELKFSVAGRCSKLDCRSAGISNLQGKVARPLWGD